MKKIIVILYAFIVSCSNLQAQNCLENLYNANKLLDAGKTEDCLTLVKPCSNSANEESIKWQAYRLMSIAYLVKGNTDSSNICAENMLDINPTYKPNLLNDPKDFINQLNSIVVIPKFTLGLAFSIGTNSTFVSIPKGYVISDYTKTYTTNENSFQFGTNLGFYLNPKLALDIGILATRKKYAIDYSFSNWEVNIKERLTYIDIPITAKYIINPKERVRVFIQGGFFSGYLIYASNDFKSNHEPSKQEYELNKLNSMDRRNRFNYGLTGGIGAFYKIKTGHLSLQANYYRSFSIVTNNTTRYSYPEQVFTFYYVDDDIILHNLAISGGYIHNLNYKVYRSKK